MARSATMAGFSHCATHNASYEITKSGRTLIDPCTILRFTNKTSTLVMRALPVRILKVCCADRPPCAIPCQHWRRIQASHHVIKTLIVDDSPLTAEVIATYLSTMPSEGLVGSASSAAEALAYAAKSDLDLVITDLRMPLVNGIELAARLRRTRHVRAHCPPFGGQEFSAHAKRIPSGCRYLRRQKRSARTADSSIRKLFPNEAASSQGAL